MAKDHEISFMAVPEVGSKEITITTKTEREKDAYICGMIQALRLVGLDLHEFRVSKDRTELYK